MNKKEEDNTQYLNNTPKLMTAMQFIENTTKEARNQNVHRSPFPPSVERATKQVSQQKYPDLH